ncbi:hypothetical protein CASFOL_013518 [Castilleja foliolosa]|uniref:F-box protein n=1 Tax=Castilleja foliolosa TaxID=1961234 RepID=A0ABD3DK75_9LAMI
MLAQGCGANDISSLHPDIINSHIFTRLDGPSLASAACCSAALRRLSSSSDLWSQICHSTWPSTASPLLSHLIPTFPGGGARAFFSKAYPIISDVIPSPPSTPPPNLISAVDIRYKDKLIFSKAQETETLTDWFRCSPFRVDMLEPKEVVPTHIRHSDGGACEEMINCMTLSWIVIDPIGRCAANLSSQNPVSARRHWLTGEVQVRYASILADEYHGHVMCGIVVTCGESARGGEMQVREVSLEMEDMDGIHLNGKDSLVFLQGAVVGKKGTGRNSVQESQRRYRKFEEMKRERRERKLRTEGALDILCVAFGVSILISFGCFLLCR